MPTYAPKAGDTTRSWYVIDATDVVLGRLAVAAATLLRGKHKPTHTPHLDMGDNVIVVNAAQVKLTGGKLDGKQYLRYSGYMGGQKSTPLKDLLGRHPDRVIHEAVWGMMPKNKLSRRQLTHLRVYPGLEHPHAAQQPRADETV